MKNHKICIHIATTLKTEPSPQRSMAPKLSPLNHSGGPGLFYPGGDNPGGMGRGNMRRRGPLEDLLEAMFAVLMVPGKPLFVQHDWPTTSANCGRLPPGGSSGGMGWCCSPPDRYNRTHEQQRTPLNPHLPTQCMPNDIHPSPAHCSVVTPLHVP